MNDLKNQVAFITEGDDDALYDHGIASIEQTLRKAQTQFNRWLELDADERTHATRCSEMLNFDYFKLLDLLTIARSRKHIEKYYDLAEIGEFPERLKPINIKADIDTADLFPPLREINRDIRRLNLERLRSAALRAARQAGGVQPQVRHGGRGRLGLPADRPRREPDPPDARQPPQADGELHPLLRADRRAAARQGATT